MEAVSTSETLVNFYQNKRRNKSEGGHIYNHRRENLKSRKFCNANEVSLTTASGFIYLSDAINTSSNFE
jgi:hypothetical protein